ncbi:hypothetical protein LIER_20328 [Lithospermum erythrorhizon]|uniref:DUF7725 domain-containing protein n=1 Tax=Lithospermum erythrorhizon TaxID=34254 RepID=A0AAV3QNU6_LITER
MAAVAAGGAARGGVALPVSSSSQFTHRERQSGRNSTNGVNQGREPADFSYHSVTIDDNVDDNLLRQKLHDVGKQREELQLIEIELRAQFLARSEIVDMQNTFDAQMKEHATAKAKLQEQLRERDQKIAELEKRMEEKEREMHVLRLDTKAAWAKEDLLREQSLELQTYRRERDSSEAERAQYIKQIHDLQEHIQEKERQFSELQEQNRIAQETIVFKDEQLREAQNWISRVQEMDALQSSSHHTLQAELRERTELYNQLWLGCRQQYGEMERLHLYIQQLQIELTEAREKNGIFPDTSAGGQTNSREPPQLEQKSGGQVDSSGNVSGDNHNVARNNVAENSSLVSMGTQDNHSIGVQMAPSSLLGLPSYTPAGQMAPLHPFVIHQQVPSNIPQTHFSHVHPVPAIQEWQEKQTPSESVPTYNQYPLQNGPGLSRSESNYGYETSVNGHIIPPDYLDASYSQSMESNNKVSSLNERREVFEAIDKSYSVSTQIQETNQQISSQFHEALGLNIHEHNGENKEKNLNHLANHRVEPQGLINEESGADTTKLSSSETSAHAVNFSNVSMNDGSAVIVPEVFSSSGKRSHHVGKLAETPLLDEKPLLACIVRTIPHGSGGRIRISSTLPNRLGKMLAPLHWHDYKKKYGKLEEFVAGHPELFVIEGDYIQLKEGAKEIIAATAAAAKVAAATAGITSHSQHLPSVAVTPMAQSHRLKILPTESISSGKTNNPSHSPAMQNRLRKGNSFHFAGAASNAKILSKPKDRLEPNGSESRSIYSAGLNGTSGTNTYLKELGASPSKVSANGRVAANVIGRQQGRAIGPATTSGR